MASLTAVLDLVRELGRSSGLAMYGLAVYGLALYGLGRSRILCTHRVAVLAICDLRWYCQEPFHQSSEPRCFSVHTTVALVAFAGNFHQSSEPK